MDIGAIAKQGIGEPINTVRLLVAKLWADGRASGWTDPRVHLRTDGWRPVVGGTNGRTDGRLGAQRPNTNRPHSDVMRPHI